MLCRPRGRGQSGKSFFEFLAERRPSEREQHAELHGLPEWRRAEPGRPPEAGRRRTEGGRHGRYFQIPDLLILRRGGVQEIVDVIRHMVRTGDLDGVLPRLDDEDDA